MNNMEKTIAIELLQIKAIKLDPAKPFNWASGWVSPIYCDNRQILSFPETRNLVRDSFCKLVTELYPEADLIAGVATGAIGHGALVADKLQMPFAYVRPTPKSHGLTNMVEGLVKPGDKVVVIEDLISTGKSSLDAVKALRDKGCTVLGMLAVFTYGFDVAAENFRTNSCSLNTLTNYEVLINEAQKNGYINSSQLDTLMEWRKDPASWGR